MSPSNCVCVCVCQVVGLGNPGMDGTRHSVGMAVLGALAVRLGVADRWRGDKYVSGEVTLSEIQHTHVVLLRPKLLMNVNGVSVAKAGAFGGNRGALAPLAAGVRLHRQGSVSGVPQTWL